MTTITNPHNLLPKLRPHSKVLRMGVREIASDLVKNCILHYKKKQHGHKEFWKCIKPLKVNVIIPFVQLKNTHL